MWYYDIEHRFMKGKKEVTEMRKAIDVANFFIDLTKDTDDHDITNLKLNKLMFYAQAWALVKLGRPIFCDPIEPWDYGPVVREVYNTFKPCKHDIIQDISGDYSEDDFTREEILLLVDVAREYGQYSASKLVSMTHEVGSPWEQAYKKEDVIRNEDIEAYFSKQYLPDFKITCSNEGCIDTRNEKGFLVLPAEWYNPEDDIYGEM